MFPSPPAGSAQDTILRMWFLLRDPKRWTQGVAARNAKGRGVKALNPDAVCWCEIGARIKSEGRIGMSDEAVNVALLNTIPGRRPRSIPEFNDSGRTSHKDILAHLCRAYALAGQIKYEFIPF